MTNYEMQLREAVRYYRRGEMTVEEISNLTGLAESTIYAELRKAFKSGEIEARKPNQALKPRTPNGQGKGKYIPTGKPRGKVPDPNSKWKLRYTGEGQGNRKNHHEKFTEAEKIEIVKDYYERNMTWNELQKKWDIHSAQMQRIRNTYGKNYNRTAPKGGRPPKEKLKNDN